MSAREVVGRLGAALLTEEATEDDAARVLVALGGPVPEPVVPPSTPDAAEPLDAVSTDLAPTGVWGDPDELARADSVAQPLAGHEEGADGAGPAPAAALPTPLLVGDLLDVGDGVTLRVEAPR